jgi:phosphatidylglycerol---prolipoprotein diacylglyceryl transferase
MHPVIFQSGAFTIYTYGVLAAAGFLVGLFYAYHQAPRAGIDPGKIWDVAVYGILVALLSSKLWLILSDWSFYAANPRAMFSITTLQSAGTFYGGVLGAILWVIFYCRLQNLPLLRVLDLTAAPVALGHAIGRLGCFAAGCCYGKPTSLPWGVTFTDRLATRLSGTPLNTPLHPTQLYESGAEFLNFALLVWFGAKKRLPGQIVGLYFVLYGIERGAMEFLRDDPGRTLLFQNKVSLMQIVSVGLVAVGAYLWLRAPRHEDKSHKETPPGMRQSTRTGQAAQASRAVLSDS